MSEYLGGSQVGRSVVLRAFAALPAAGAFDAAPLEIFCAGQESAMLYLAYTRAAAGGDVRFRLELSGFAVDTLAPAGMPVWYRASVLQPGAVASGGDTISNVQRDTVEYGSTGAAQEAWVYGPIQLAKSVERIRLAAAESGVVGTPGSFGAYLVMAQE